MGHRMRSAEATIASMMYDISHGTAQFAPGRVTLGAHGTKGDAAACRDDFGWRATCFCKSGAEAKSAESSFHDGNSAPPRRKS